MGEGEEYHKSRLSYKWNLLFSQKPRGEKWLPEAGEGLKEGKMEKVDQWALSYS